MASGLTAALEDYLEAIYLIFQKAGTVRVKDVAEHLKVKEASVSEAVRRLVERGLLKHERYGELVLTEKGRKTAREIYKRHQVLQKFFKDILGVNEETAYRDACAIEHAISRETLQKLIEFVEKLQRG